MSEEVFVIETQADGRRYRHRFANWTDIQVLMLRASLPVQRAENNEARRAVSALYALREDVPAPIRV